MESLGLDPPVHATLESSLCCTVGVGAEAKDSLLAAVLSSRRTYFKIKACLVPAAAHSDVQRADGN